jgi:hypothetical protein
VAGVPDGDCEAMETLVEKISWRRGGVRNDFVGSLRAGDEGIRLTGRDPQSGIDVALSIPPEEVADVHVSPSAGDPPGDLYVVLELDDAEPIYLRQVGAGPLHAQLLARKLGALARPPRLLVQGG